jgi:mannan endo-1,4-beta-mannosidase
VCLHSRPLWTLALAALMAAGWGGCGSGTDSLPTGPGAGGASDAQGVVVHGECVPLCADTTEPADAAEPDWGCEDGAPCVIPDTPTAAAQVCVPDGSEPSDPAGRPGVVVLFTETDATECVPLCVDHTDPEADPEGDDWAFENCQSCVIPGTPTSYNQECTTGQAVPEPEDESLPGVVTLDDDGERICTPLCVINTDPEADAEGDDWSWENNASCVIPATPTAANQACTTGEPVPDPEPRPGIILEIDAEIVCVPICRIVTTPTDDSASDWSWEDNERCVLPGTPTTEDRRECVYAEYPPEFVPPALTGNKVADGFYTEGGRLYDAYGQDFVIRGVNNPHIYFDTYARYDAYRALDAIASYGTNTIRVVWNTTDGSPTLLAEILYRIVELEMVPMVELHDVTGGREPELLMQTAEYYTQDDVKQVLDDFREYLLVNIANEWSGGDSYAATYADAIELLRSSGINHTLVIDASGYAQNAPSVFDNADALLAGDPEHNLLFSLHMYTAYSSAAQVDSVLNQAVDSSVPLIVGEFGLQLSGTDVAWEQILATCTELGLGYIAWSWMGNDAGTAHLDMAEDWGGPLTQWGQDVMTGPNGIAETSEKASIFE